MKKNTFILLLCQFGIIFFLMGTPIEDVEQRYNVSESSSYQQLLDAMGQAIIDLKSDSEDATAYSALDTIYGWVPVDKRLQFNYDRFLQPNNDLFVAGIEGAKESLEAGQVPEQSLKQNIADAIWQKLNGLQPSNDENKAIGRSGVSTLLLLLDDRGLEAILTDKGYIKNLQAVDQWNDESPTATFAALKQQYDGLIEQQPGARERAAIYELCRLRKVAGAPRIESTASVINLANF